MSRSKEINNDLWDILRKVYGISDITPKSEKQQQLLDSIVEYIDANLSTRKKRPDKEKICSKELNS
jgi:uncharacterized protein YlxP (DUF503 family)